MRDNRHVVFFREAAGDENWRAWCADLETGDVNQALEARNAVITELMSELDQLAVAIARFTRGSGSCPINLPTPCGAEKRTPPYFPDA
jgi:hypothetical protein